MSKVYKIHPGIGIARVGKSTAGILFAGEAPGAGPFDIGPDGRDMAFAGYKDSGHIIRRQGVRFRVFEYDKNDATEGLTLTREITRLEARIDWTVQLAAAKAHSFWMTLTSAFSAVLRASRNGVAWWSLQPSASTGFRSFRGAGG